MRNFEPKMVGTPDIKRRKRIHNYYDELIDITNDVLGDLQAYFEEDLTPEEFERFINAPDPKVFITSRYVEINNISVPGISTEKLIEKELINLPDFSIIIEKLKELKSFMKKKENEGIIFDFPLSGLWDPKCTLYVLNEEFNNQLVNQTQNYTTSQEQNDILEGFNMVVEGLNVLVNKNLVNTNLSSISNLLLLALDVEEKKYIVNRNIFSRRRFKN